MKRFLGVKFSQRIFNKKFEGEIKSKQLSLPEAMFKLRNINPKDFKEYVDIFREIEDSIHKTIMKRINDNNGDITKIFELKMYTYEPSQILRDLQKKAKNDPKLLGNVNPRYLTWIK